MDTAYGPTGTWNTNSPIADIFMVWANRARIKTRSADFFWNAECKAWRRQPVRRKLSLRATAPIRRWIIMDAVEVPADNLLPDASGLKGPFGCLNDARYGIRWARWGRLRPVRGGGTYTLQRRGLTALAANQLIEKLADMQTEIALGFRQLYASAGCWTREARSGSDIARQRNNASKALDIARLARDKRPVRKTGTRPQLPVMRHLANLEDGANTYRAPTICTPSSLGARSPAYQAFF